jgi:hypothetical protein
MVCNTGTIAFPLTDHVNRIIPLVFLFGVSWAVRRPDQLFFSWLTFHVCQWWPFWKIILSSELCSEEWPLPGGRRETWNFQKHIFRAFHSFRILYKLYTKYLLHNVMCLSENSLNFLVGLGLETARQFTICAPYGMRNLNLRHNSLCLHTVKFVHRLKACTARNIEWSCCRRDVHILSSSKDMKGGNNNSC